MKIAVIAINSEGKKLAEKLRADFHGVKIFNRRMNRKGELKNFTGRIFNQYDGLIVMAALGITVRLIAPFVRSKFHDPAVVSVDTAGRFSISVLSGHEGGANRLAFLVAASLGAVPVVTTGHEVHKKYILGLGTRRGISSEQVKKAITRGLQKAKVKLEEIRLATTFTLKKNEKGLIKACKDLGLPILFIPKESIENFKSDLPASEIVRRHFGLSGVCEPCALLAGRRTELILRKQIQDGVTIAIAEEN